MPRTAVLATLLLALSTCNCTARGAANDELAGRLSFEDCGNFGTPTGWHGGPVPTLAIDSSIAHSGKRSGRITRDEMSERTFSAMTLSLPVDFTGKTVELRGWLRLEGVKGFAGLWQRQDGVTPTLQFDNMQSRNLSGTIDWKEYRVVLPLDPKARSVYFGALLSGTGRVWADDIELLVDGHPLSAAPKRTVKKTAIDTDLEFEKGSRIETSKLSPVQVDNLVTLGKVWGFVKYRHPRVTAAEVQWDYELFRVLPAVLSAKDHAAANAAIDAWLAKLGEPAPCKPCAQEVADAQMAPRLAWIHDRARLGDALVQRLALIHERRDADGEQYYVNPQPVGAPDFSNEQAYLTASPPDAGYRLLGLYRFWNIVESWYPYRDVMNEDWDGVLATFIPRVFASTANDYALEMMQVIARVHDSHVNLWSSLPLRPPAGDSMVPTVLRSVDGQFVVAEQADTTRRDPQGLLPGDAIVAIDGVPVQGKIASWLPYYGASNEDAARRDIALALTRGPSGPVRIKRDRGGTLEEVTLQRVAVSPWQLRGTHDRQCQTFVRASDDVAYLKLSSVRMEDTEDYVRRAQNARLLIIDIRNYPSQFVVFALGQHLVSSKTEFATFTQADFANPGTFVWRTGVSLEPREPHITGKVVILVDEVSQSQSEYTALAFRSAPGALVVGSTTAGADGNVASIALPGGLKTMISGLGVFDANRKPTQRVGIVPDVVVRPTRAGIAAGRDEVLEAAVQRALGRSLTPAESGELRLN